METPLPADEKPQNVPNENAGREPLPDGPPEPVPPSPTFGGMLFNSALVVTAAGGLAALLIGNHPGRCAGATRSSRLEWESRQEQIDAALQAAQSIAPPTAVSIAPVTAEPVSPPAAEQE